jgi:hypothetical protein
MKKIIVLFVVCCLLISCQKHVFGNVVFEKVENKWKVKQVIVDFGELKIDTESVDEVETRLNESLKQ